MPSDRNPPLLDQKALVTGASSGIGAAIALTLAQAGAAVGVNYRTSEEAANRIVNDIRAVGGQAIALRADVAREEDVDRLMSGVVEAFGRIDILVANSGIQSDASLPDMTLQQWQRVIDVNLTGQFFSAHGLRSVASWRNL